MVLLCTAASEPRSFDATHSVEMHNAKLAGRVAVIRVRHLNRGEVMMPSHIY